MPKTQYRKKRTYQKKTYRQQKAVIKRVVHSLSEYKSQQFTLVSLFPSISSSWIEQDILGSIIQGTDAFGQRVGRQISVSSLQIKGLLFGGATGSGGLDDYYNDIRMVVMRTKIDKLGGAITPLTASGITINSPLTKNSIAGLDKVYSDKYIGLTNNPYGNALCAPAHRAINMYLKFKTPLKITYTGTGADRNQTQLYICLISDSGIIPSPGMTVGFVKVNYTDA